MRTIEARAAELLHNLEEDVAPDIEHRRGIVVHHMRALLAAHGIAMPRTLMYDPRAAALEESMRYAVVLRAEGEGAGRTVVLQRPSGVELLRLSFRTERGYTWIAPPDAEPRLGDVRLVRLGFTCPMRTGTHGVDIEPIIAKAATNVEAWQAHAKTCSGCEACRPTTIEADET